MRGREDAIAVMYAIHWKHILRSSWEHEGDKQHSRRHTLLHWVRTQNQHRQTNRLHRTMLTGAASRKLSRQHEDYSLAPGYELLPRGQWKTRYRDQQVPMYGRRPRRVCGEHQKSTPTPRLRHTRSSASWMIRAGRTPHSATRPM